MTLKDAIFLKKPRPQIFEQKIDTRFLFWHIIPDIVWVLWPKGKYLRNTFFQVVK